ncbi:MAG: M20/M25/M40 family metallo-hydrolase [Candidatus Acidiferrales bacterium]
MTTINRPCRPTIARRSRTLALSLAFLSCPALAQKSTATPQAAAPPQHVWLPPAQVAQEARDFRTDNEDRIVRELVELLEIPNVAGDAENIQRNAVKLREMLEARGIETHLLPSAGRGPVIFGKLLTPEAARTVVFYAHYDGYAVYPAAWTSGKPFEPALWTAAIEGGGKRTSFLEAGHDQGVEYQDDWRVYARSAADDKAPIVALLVAIDALRANRIPLAVNLKIILDGQGEADSPELERVAALNKSPLGGDVLITTEGPADSSGRPVVSFVSGGSGPQAAHPPKDSLVARKVVELVEGAAGDFAKQSTIEERGPVRIFERLGLPVIAVPIVNFDSHQHAADENVRLGNVWRGIEIYAVLLADLTW